MSFGRNSSSRQAGLTYIEAIVSTLIVAAALAPMTESLRSGVAATRLHRVEVAERQRLVTRIEEVLAKPFASLDAQAVASGNGVSPAYSDAAGTSGRILVTVSRSDAAGATTADTGLVQVQAAIENSTLALATLRAR